MALVHRGYDNFQVQIVVASYALTGSKQPQKSDLTSDLKPAALITLVSMFKLPLTAILVASEAMVASRWPQRSLLAFRFALGDLKYLCSHVIFPSKCHRFKDIIRRRRKRRRRRRRRRRPNTIHRFCDFDRSKKIKFRKKSWCQMQNWGIRRGWKDLIGGFD